MFTETMLGTVRLDGDPREARVRLDLRADADRVLLPHRTTNARLTGRVRITGHTDDPGATGELEISPIARRRIRYRLAFTLDGRRLTLDGWKSVTPRHPFTSMTVLPFTLYDGEARAGEGVLRFPAATGLAPFLLGFRFPAASAPSGTWPPAGTELRAAPRSGTPPSPTPTPAPACGCTTNSPHPRTDPHPSRTAGSPPSPATARSRTPASDPSPGPGRRTDSPPTA